MRRLFPALLSLLCLLAWLPVVHAQQSDAQEDDGVLVLGRVSDDPKTHYDQLKPLLDLSLIHI